MTKEEKQLLLVDLSARLPYGVKLLMNEDNHIETLYQINTNFTDIDGFPCLVKTHGQYDGFYDLNEFKPYLRPLSSMTKEEKKELNSQYVVSRYGNSIYMKLHSDGYWDTDTDAELSDYLYLINYFNKHHFDYRGLIPMGLAIEDNQNIYEIS